MKVLKVSVRSWVLFLVLAFFACTFALSALSAIAQEEPAETVEEVAPEVPEAPEIEENVIPDPLPLPEAAPETVVEETVTEPVVEEPAPAGEISVEETTEDTLVEEVPTPEEIPVLTIIEETPIESTTQTSTPSTSEDSSTEESTLAEPTQTPELSTDKDDYHPGETATIFGRFFAPVKQFVLKVFGSDDNNDNYTETEEVVETDESGSFSFAYLLDSLYRPFYEVVVSTLEGEKVAETWFRDSSVQAYDQCSNDDGDGYATGDTECRWITGAINPSNSTYFEGDSTIHRTWVDGFDPSANHTITFKYGTTKGGKHAYDYLTTYNASENSTASDRCAGITGCISATESQTAMTDDPVLTNVIEPSPASRFFTIRGGTITAVSAPTIVSGDYSGDSETVVTVTIDVDGTGPMCTTKKVQGQDVTSCGVAIWFGAHIAESTAWMDFNNTTGAGSISGAPYHVALASVDNVDATQGGGRDNQMQASTVVIPTTGTIVVDKVTVPSGDAQSFSFNTTGTGYTGFSLDDNDAPNSQTLNAGTYSVSETVPTGWVQTSATCVSSIQDTETPGNIELDPEEIVTCTFTNTKQGKILIDKVTNPSGSNQSFEFDPSWSANNFNLTDAATAQDSGFLAPGSYSVAEVNVPTGWTLTNTTCSDGSPVNNISLAAGETVTCTFTNTQNGTIIVDKVTDPSGDPQSFDFTAGGTGYVSFSLTDAAQPNSQSVVPGKYSVSEGAVTGWDLTSATCDQGETMGDIDVGAGETVTCTFNNQKDASIIVEKQTLPDGSAQSFEFDTNYGTNFFLTDGQQNDSGDLEPGNYSVDELTPSGWNETSAICTSTQQGDQSTAANISLQAGETVTCVFTNTQNGSITIEKQVVGADADFTFTGDVGGTLSDNEAATVSVAPGTYSSVESAHSAYDLTSIACDDNDSTGNTGTRTATFNVAAGENVKCVFTNSEKPTLTLTKSVVNDNGGTAVVNDFQGKIDGNNVPWGAAQTFSPGSYTASETTLAGYTASSWGGDCNVNGGVTLDYGDHKTCSITNNDNAPALHLRKIVVNDNGGTATLADFTLTANGAGANDISGTSPVDSGAGLLADTFALSETGPSGYTASNWVCVGGAQNGSNITLGLGQEATCTITNDDNAPSLTLVKQVINDNGGSATASQFTLTATGPTGFSGAGPSVANGTSFDAGTYDLSETNLPGYTASDWVCIGGTQNDADTVSVGLGESATCTITNNDQQAFITVVKVVTNDNGGSAAPNDFNLTLEGSSVSSGVAVPVNPGTYTAAETLLSGYTFEGYTGDCDSNGDVTVALGESKTCTLTNNDQQSYLIVDKTVVNDDGGTAAPNDFLLTIDNSPTTDGAIVPVSPGNHTAGETVLPGYTAGAWGGDCAANGSVAVPLGTTKTCTITNNDNAPTLKLVKLVTNDNGGNAVSDDWTLSATAANPYDARNFSNAGSGVFETVFANAGYDLAETSLPGYTAGSWSCDGGSLVGSTVTLGLDADVTCTITNDDVAPTITLIKVVNNDFGGTADENDFGLTIGGTAVTSGQVLNVNANTPYALNEALITPAYEFVSLTGDPECPAVLGGTVTADEGENITCTITNQDKPGHLIVHKVTNPEDTATEFSINASGGTIVTPAAAQSIVGGGTVDYTVHAGTFDVEEADLAGWDETGNTCVDIVVANGETEECTITNTKRGEIVLVKNTVGGDGSFDFVHQIAGLDSTLTTNAGTDSDTSDKLVPSDYSISETVPAGWDLTSATCDQEETVENITVGAGETVTCTFTNTKRGHIVIVKDVIGDPDPTDFTFQNNFGNDNPASFMLDEDTNGTLPSSRDFEVLPGTYAVSEDPVANWQLESATCDQGETIESIDVAPGETVTCTFVNEELISITLIKNTIGGDGTFDFTLAGDGLPLSDQLTTVGGTKNVTYTGLDQDNEFSIAETIPTGWDLTSAVCTGDETPESITPEPSEDVTCTFTNTKDSYIIVKKETDPDGDPQVFSFIASYDNDGFSLSDGQENNSGDIDAGTYSVSETVPSGWDLESATCDDGSLPSAIDLAAGETVTCTFTNEKDANIVVVKETVPEGEEQAFSFNASYDLDGFALSHGQQNDSGDLDPGTYSVSEEVPNGWDLTDTTCVSSNEDTETADTISLQAGETVTCTFTNTKDSFIIVQKTTIGGDANFSFTSTYGLDFQLSNGQSSNSGDINAGTYSVSEINVPAGWANTSATCSDGSDPASIDLAPGETVTCTFVNNKPAAQIDVTPPSAFNAIGDEHVVTVSVQVHNGNGTWGPAPDNTLVTFTLLNNNANASFVGGDICTTTNGSCTVTIDSTETGGVDIHASADPVLLGVTMHVETDGQGDNSEDGHKTYVNARISITPETDTNEVDDDHVFTVLVEQSVENNIWTPVENAVVDVMVAPAPGTLDEADCADGTNAIGECTATINSASAGVFTADATTNISVNGVAFNLSTDGEGENSDSATKTYVDASIELTPQTGTNEVDDEHEIIATVTKDDGNGSVPAEGVTVTFTITSGSAEFVSGDNTCDTNSSGECSISIIDDAAGQNSIDASVTVHVGGLDLLRATNGDAGPDGSDAAAKTYVDAKISIDPLEATNNVGEAHEFTVTVLENDGDGFDPAVGETVNFSMTTNTAGAVFVDDIDSCVTDASGQCSIMINSDAPGEVTMHATTDVSVGGLILTRATDSTHGSSGDASKTYVAGKIIVKKVTVGGDSEFEFDTSYGDNFFLSHNETNDSGYLSLANTYSIDEVNIPNGWEEVSASCDNGDDPSEVTLSEDGEVVTCTVTNGKLPTLKLEKTVVTNNGGTATEDDFHASIDDTEVAWDAVTTLEPGSYVASEEEITGYAASAWGGDCDADGNITLAYGDVKVCTITNDDIPPKLTLIKEVVNDDGGDAISEDWLLSASSGSSEGGGGEIGGGSTSISGAGGATSGPDFKKGTYTLSESGPGGYDASDWVCEGGVQNDDQITLNVGEEATCVITNDDIPAKITLIKNVINDNGGTAGVNDFGLSIGGNAAVSGGTTYEVDSNTEHALNETGLAGYEFISITGDGCPADLGGTVTLDEGEEITCTITNDDIAPRLTVIKHVVNDHGGAAVAGDFTMNVTGTEVSDASFPGEESPGTTVTLDAGTYSVDEDANDDYVKTIGENCSGTIAIGETKTCTITNDDIPAKLTIVKDADPNDLQDFAFSGTNGLGNFTLDDDAGVFDETNSLNTHSNTAVFEDLSWGEYTVTETLPNSFWTHNGVVCVSNNTGEFVSVAVTNGVTVMLDAGDDVTCTFTNERESPTRTQGFWQTHTQFTSFVFNLPSMQKYIGENVAPILPNTTHKGQITNTQSNGASQLFGAFFSNIAQKTTGKGKAAQRSDIDKARMQLLQQLTAAKLNCAAFGCTTKVLGMLSAADNAFKNGTSTSAILFHAGVMDAYNNSGDTIIPVGLPNPGKATPKTSKAWADIKFWDNP